MKYKYKAKVLRIVDGDTMDLMIDIGFNLHIKERVRLYGIDTPETRTRDMNEKIRGYEAKEYVKSLVESVNNEVEIETHKQKKGKFGRYLAIIFVEGINLNQQLINEGLAKEYLI